MRRGTRVQLAIALILAGAFASAAMARVALARETTGATGSTGSDVEWSLTARPVAGPSTLGQVAIRPSHYWTPPVITCPSTSMSTSELSSRARNSTGSTPVLVTDIR